MLFNSLPYLILLSLTVLLFYRFNENQRPVLLLIASSIFYAFVDPFGPLILFTVAITGFYLGMKIPGGSDKKKKIILLTGIGLNIFALIFFRDLYKSLITLTGISFFTFQNISYLADCYLEKIEPEKNLIYYALYISFFPKLLQGPIERGDRLIPQLKTGMKCNYETLKEGSLLFAWGMFKKIVIADNLALMTTRILHNVPNSNGLEIFVSVYLYAIQIYCDFSGYTDMALGSGALFGIKLTDNFKRPYLAPSVQEFWRRWHISLSSWILDYIFKPLQMKWRNYGNVGLIGGLVITFLICGLWHGLTINYIVWGLYHGIIISLSFLTYKKIQKYSKKYNINQTLLYVVNVIITFHLICFSWIIFMTNSMGETWLILWKIAHMSLQDYVLYNFQFVPNNFFYFSMILFLIIEIIREKRDLQSWFQKRNTLFRWVCYYILMFNIIFLGNYGTETANAVFIYFKF